jgi:murein DD-endopeptidase MepM/ murein hydrolase activator NlpD
VTIAAVFAWTPHVSAQAKTARGGNAYAYDCGGGITVRFVPARAVQGGLLRLEVHRPTALATVTGEWAAREAVRSVPFWRDARYKGLFHGFLGIDLAQPPGKYELKLTVQPESSESVSCAVPVSVMAGRFPEEKLTVAPKYVEPNPEDTKRAEEEGERLRALFGTATPDKLWTGAFRLPLPGIHTAKNFGRRRVLNGTPGSAHSGVDIPAVEGTPIHASQRGRVVLAGNLYFAGNTVVIDHGLGVYTLYGHMKVLGVQKGETVAAGAVIGRVGATGRVTGPHLHWGLTLDDSRVNALDIVGLPGS